MIVWSGWGFLVILLSIPAGMIGVVPFVIFDLVTGTHHAVGPFLLSIVSALWGVFCIVVGRLINDPRKDRVVFDAITNQKLLIRKRSTLFWIPMQYWGYPLIVAAVVLAVVQLLAFLGLSLPVNPQ